MTTTRPRTRRRAETTIMWTAGAAGMLAFAVMWWVVDTGRGHPIDTFGFDAFGSRRGTLLASIAHPLALYVPWLAAACGVVVAILLLRRRRWADAATVAVGPPLIALAVHIAKSAEQRPRPPGPLTPDPGYSFPSSAAALSITAIAVAAVFARHAGPHTPRARAAIAGGIALSIATGILMVAIRVHYLTDVIGGWGLGLAVFAAWAGFVGRIERLSYR